MALEKIICQVCGSEEFDSVGGTLRCKYCRTGHVQKTDAQEILLQTAERELDILHFENAEDEFRDFAEKYPHLSAGYWGQVRAKYGIKYVSDYNGKRIPVCHAARYEDISNDPVFKKAVEKAESQELQNKYLEEGKKIKETCEEWRETAKKYTYDIFISFKATDNDRRTEDYSDMQNLYTYLTEKGYKVFFSPVSAMEFSGKKYDAYIHNALEKAKVLILYGSKEEYFTSVWVKTEWTRYLRMIGKGLKQKGSLLVACKGVNPGNLPRELRSLQAFDATNMRFYEQLKTQLKLLLETSKEPTVKYCLSCGAENPIKNRFCSECGGRDFAESKEAYEAGKIERERQARIDAEREREEERLASERKLAEAEREKRELAERLQRMEEAQKSAAANQTATDALMERLQALEAAQKAQKAQNIQNAAPMYATNAPKEEQPHKKTAEDFYREAQDLLAKRDYKNAFTLLQTAANMGDQNALYALAEAYEQGQGVEADEDKALELYRKVKLSKATADVTRIMNSRTSRREATYQRGVKLYHAKDEVGALKEFEKSATFGDLCGQYETAHRYMRGVGTKADVKKAVEYYEQVIADKDAATKRASSQTYYTDYGANIKTESLFALGKAYCFEEAVKDVERGVVCLLQAADGNHKEALWLLAQEYERGEIVSPDKKKAVDYVMRAAKAACTPAKYDLARRYEEGDGVEKSLVKSIELYDSMAELWRDHHYAEYKAAQDNVDRILEKNASLANEDYEQAKAFASRHEHDKAYPLFEEAAWLGHVGGMAEFASVCESEMIRFTRAKKAEDATRSYYKAQDWYKKAAEKGHLKATLWVAKDEEKNHHDVFAAASYKRAIASLEQAQKSGESVDREVVFELADVYLRGVGDQIKASADKAIAVLTPLSSEGDAEAKWKVAEIYYDLFKKNNSEPNKKKALELYEELAADSNAGERGDQARKFLESLKEAAAKTDGRNEYYFKAGNIYFDRGEYEKAAPMYELLAQKGHLGGTYRYAVCLLKGGVKMSEDLAHWEASGYFQKSVPELLKLADEGDETALWLMGEAYADGYLVLKDENYTSIQEFLNGTSVADALAWADKYKKYQANEPENKKASKAHGYEYWERLAGVKQKDKDEPTDLAKRAIYELAYHYFHDEDISRQTAYAWNWRAMYTDCLQRDEAIVNVAGLYAHNTEVDKQVTGKKLGLKIAVQLYQIAAELGHSIAEQSLKALKKEKGLALVFAGGPKLNISPLIVNTWKESKENLAKSDEEALQKASRMYAEEQEEIRLRKEEEKRKERERTQQELDRLQKQGWDAKRFFEYAKGVTSGKWFTDDEKLEKVFHYLERAAKLGHAEAAYVTGCGYLDGRAVDKDAAVAASWFQQAAAQGNADAASNLGDMYKSGKGVKKDLNSARQYYTKAAQSNSVPAQTHAMIELGIMCRDGKGGPKDMYSAKFWIEKAASYGATRAETLLKKMK